MKVLCILKMIQKEECQKLSFITATKIEKHPDGMTLPSPKGRDYTPAIIRCVSGELGLEILESNGYNCCN